jgi:preprotein translocase subunit SecF
VGALIATGHDVFVTAGFYSFLSWIGYAIDFNINTVAALLLLAGYSINDTVVVFDRLREKPAQVQAHVAGRHDQSVHQPDRHPHHPGVGGYRLVGDPAPVRRTGAAEFQHRHSVRHLVGTFSSTYVAGMLLLYLPAVGGTGDTKTEEAPA